LILFTQYFPYPIKKGINKISLFLLSLPIVFFLIILPTGYFFLEINYQTNPPSPVFNPTLYLVNSIVTYGYTLVALALFIYRRNKETGIHKLQLNYLILGITLTVILVFFTNMILPLINIHDLRQSSSFLFLIFDGFALVTLNKKRFYGLSTLLLQGLKSFILGLILFVIVFSIRFIQSKFFQLDFFQIESQLIDLFACVLVASFLIMFLDKYENSLSKLTNNSYLSNKVLFKKIEEIVLKHYDIKHLNLAIIELLNSYFSETKTLILQEDYNYITSINPNEIYIVQESSNPKINQKLKALSIAIISKLNENHFLILQNKENQNAYDKNEIELIEEVSSRLRLHYKTEELYQKTRDFNDILQQKVKEQTDELQSAFNKLKREDEGKNDILNIVSHQLLTPISIIRGDIEELKEAADKKAKDEIINVLAFQAKRSYEIVDEILRVSRVIQKGSKLDVVKSETSIIELIEGVVDTFKKKATAKNLALKFSKGDIKSDIKINIDKEQIIEVISNLVDNAINYTPSGSITIVLENQVKQVIIKVIDTGIGIKKENISELFNKFVRLDNAKKIRPDGTGIGLYFIKLIIDAHNGDIDVKSEGEGKGSQFIIKLSKK
jgi:signal transduction histidine kinase